MDARQVNLRSLHQQWERLLEDVEAPLAAAEDTSIIIPVSEDVHDASIIPFMLSAPKGDDGMGARGEATPIIEENVIPHLERVEAHLTSLDERIKKCPLQSVLFFKSILENITPEVDKMLRYPRKVQNETAISSLSLTIAVYSVPPKGSPFRYQVLDVPGETSLASLVERITCPMNRILNRIAQIGSDPLPSWPPPSPPSPEESQGETYELRMSDQTYHNDELRQITWMEISDALTINKPYRLTHCHHACVHYLMVEDIRRTHPYDTASPFPNQPYISQESESIQETYHVRRRRRRCRICDLDRASWVTTHDRLAPENPCLFCDTCYAALHYDSQGGLIYSDYRVYPYHYDLSSR